MIVAQIDGAVRVITLSRPEKLNALTMAMTVDLLRELRAAMADPVVRVLLLHGAGTSFCAGKDKAEPGNPVFAALLQSIAEVLMEGPKPVVVAVQGWVVGAGLEMMLNADVSVAARNARFLLPETRIGLLGTGAVSATLPAAIGLPRAKAMLMLGSELNAEQAERWGLVSERVDADDALPAALAIAQELAANDQQVLAQTKALMNQAAIGPVAAALARETAAHEALLPPSAG
ncbi:MAG TPA: enoyl-CoA hydratase-related protein [Ideonella sp.]|nr:enoyl-CoA hydratase-related protein [Ideonella sp.]